MDEETDGESAKRPAIKIAEIKCQKWKHVNFIRISSDGVVIHLESDILEGEVKWALGSITINKANGGDGIPAELLQILKYDTVKSAALNMPANLEKGLEKISFHSNPKERQCQRIFKLQYNCTDFTS